MLEPLAKVFGVSIPELLSGNAVQNVNVSANIMRSKFYVCPVCGNSIHSMGEAMIHCHGIPLTPCTAEETDENHKIFIERVEDDYFVQIEHDMTKQHYISFIAALSFDKIQMVKLYPEGNAEARFEMRGVRQILFYCNRDGLFQIKVNKAIDGKEKSYDDRAERQALEDAAKRFFG
jgi:desulfoferrodoxin (superoxide reductase-like protein)